VPRSKNAWSYTSTPPIHLCGVVISLNKAQGQLYFLRLTTDIQEDFRPNGLRSSTNWATSLMGWAKSPYTPVRRIAYVESGKRFNKSHTYALWCICDFCNALPRPWEPLPTLYVEVRTFTIIYTSNRCTGTFRSPYIINLTIRRDDYALNIDSSVHLTDFRNRLCYTIPKVWITVYGMLRRMWNAVVIAWLKKKTPEHSSAEADKRTETSSTKAGLGTENQIWCM
jgi:hypothetical protein